MPTALIAGFGKASSLANENHGVWNQEYYMNKQYLLTELNSSGIYYSINGDPDSCINNSISISFKGVNAEALMLALREDCAISNGSACTANEYSLSHVLLAMGLNENTIEESVRISWGIEPITGGVGKLIHVIKELQ